MTPDQLANMICLFFGRAGLWFLDGMTLAEFCCNRRFPVDAIEIGMLDVSRETFVARCKAFEFPVEWWGDQAVIKIHDHVVKVSLYEKERKNTVKCEETRLQREWIICDPETVAEFRKKNPFMSGAGVWRVPFDRLLPIEMNIPYMAGHILDEEYPLWWKTLEHVPVDWGINDIFFDEERQANGVELLGQLYECGKAVGIDRFMFPGFGTALGIVRHGGFVPHDRDMDMCFLADRFTPEQGMKFAQECQNRKLDEHRWRPPQCRDDTGMPLWFSLGPKSPVADHGVKSCIWNFFEYSGYYWHSKGGLWISPAKFNPAKTNYTNQDAAIAKGIPSYCIGELIPYSFRGLDILLPDKLGCCLGHWYPNWMVPSEGASAHSHVMVIGDWNDKSTWRFS